MKTRHRPNNGLTLIELTIVLAVLAVLLAILLPAMSKGPISPERSCYLRLRQIGLSFRQWRLDNNDKFPTEVSTNNGGAMEWAQQGIAWPVFQVVSNELNTPKILICPADSNVKRVMATTFGSPVAQSTDPQIPFTNNQSLSYFVGLDAINSRTNLLLAGDSHFAVGGKALAEGLQGLNSQQAIGWTTTRHPKRIGNLGFADGSVRPFTSKELPAVFKATGLATNRLVLP